MCKYNCPFSKVIEYPSGDCGVMAFCDDCPYQYRWHDLRKNPEDLPQDIGNVLIASDDGEVQVGYYWGEKFEWNVYNPDHTFDWEYVEAEDAMVNVIAWRNIEPFEEVE